MLDVICPTYVSLDYCESSLLRFCVFNRIRIRLVATLEQYSFGVISLVLCLQGTVWNVTNLLGRGRSLVGSVIVNPTDA